MIYNLMIKSLSFSEPVSLGFDFHKCFFAVIPPLVETGRLEGAGVE